MIKRLLCLLLIFAMIIPVLASCGDNEDPESTDPPTQNNSTNNGNNNNNNNNENNGGNQASTDDNKPTVEDKYPWLERIYRFSAEEFKLAPNEKAGIVAYLMGLGTIASDADDAAITEVLNALALNHRHNVQFASLSAMTVISDDYTYRQDYLYKLDIYKNLVLYSPEDTAMTEKLTAPVYALSFDGKTLTLKVPFSYTTVDGEGKSSTVNCKSYSLITLTRDDNIKLSDIPDVVGKAYKLHNFAYRFASEEALADFEDEKGMPISAWLATENAQITESNSGVLRVEAKNKLVCEKIVGNGIAISEFSYYISIGAGGAVTLYNTEKGRDDKDENDVVTAVSVSFAPDGKTAVVSEGTDVQRLRVYTFDKAIEEEIIPGVSGKVYKLSEYTYRFATDSDRVALETAQGKSLDAIIVELNATITEKRYKTLTVTDDGKVVCEIVTESGSVISEFTYFAVVGENGVMTLYKTAAGRENVDANELVSGISITVTSTGVEIATPISVGSESVQIEVYQFDKDFEKESVSDPKGNVYKLSEYGFKFANEADIAVLESAEGKTVAEIISALNASITESVYRTLTVDKNGRFVCTSVKEGGVTATVFSYYGVIGDDGEVTLYKTATGRENADAKELVTDVAVDVTAKGIEVATPMFVGSESSQIEVFAFDKKLEESSADVLGSSYLLDNYNYQFDSAEALAAFEAENGKTVVQVLAEERAELASSYGKRLTVAKNYSVKLYLNLASNVNVVALRGYADIADDGTVTLYKTAEGRDSKDANDLVNTDIVIKVTSSGIELAYPITGGWHIEIYAFDEVLPVYNGIPTVAGTSFESVGSEIRYMNAIEKQRLDQEDMTSEVIFSQISGKRTVYLDSYGRIFCVKTVSGVDTVEWLYYFIVNEDGSITRYKTENGRDSGLASDIVKDGMYFSVSPDGSKLEFLQEVSDGYATLAVVHMNFKENVQEDSPKLTEKVYLSGASTPLIWVFDENGVLTAFQNNAILYTYYAKVIAGKVSFYTDPDARDMGDENYLVSSLSADLLLNGSVLLLSNGTTLHYNDAYTKAQTPTLSFGSNVKTEYVEASNLNIDLSGNLTTNSNGAKIFQWFEGRGMYKSPITSAPKTEGEYTLRVTTVPTSNYKTAAVEIVITVVTYEEFTEDCVEVTMQNTVTLRKGQKYIADVVISAGQHLMFLDGASQNTQIYRFCFEADDPDYIWLNEIIIEEDLKWMGEVHDYVCSDDGRPIVFYTEQYIGKTYRVVWTASENCTVDVGTYRIY